MRRGLGSISVRSLVAVAAGCVFAIAALCALPATTQAQPMTPIQTAAVAQTFPDIRGDEWFAEAVYALALEGIVEGRQDGSFGPDDSLTRAEMAVFLARVLGLPESTGQPFFDVTAHDWFADAVGALFHRSLVHGTSTFVFSPNEPVSQQQAATLVMRSLDFAVESDPESAVEYELAEGRAAVWLAGFRDRPQIAPDHAVSVANAYRLGIIDSPVDGWFYPELNLTRAQMAVMLYRAFLQPVEASNCYPVELSAVSAYATQSVGSEGTLVSFLEARLTALHYPCGPVDGVYDHRTKDAVMAFEKVEQLKRDGTVGAEVWQRIFSAQTPTPRRSLGGIRSEVDLTRQVLFMITDNRVWKIVHVSTGRLGTRTGHHVVGAKYEGWVRTVTIVGEMYYPSYIVSKTAIHGYRSVPPYPASHGCVRVPMWMAVQLYHELPKGRPVDVYY